MKELMAKKEELRPDHSDTVRSFSFCCASLMKELRLFSHQTPCDEASDGVDNPILFFRGGMRFFRGRWKRFLLLGYIPLVWSAVIRH